MVRRGQLRRPVLAFKLSSFRPDGIFNRTHEVGSNGAVSVTDLWTGETRILGWSLQQ